MSHPNPDRLGDAVRELAHTMSEHGKHSMRFTLVSSRLRVTYEMRIVKVRVRADGGGEAATDIEAFGPAPSVANEGARSMADNEKE